MKIVDRRKLDETMEVPEKPVLAQAERLYQDAVASIGREPQAGDSGVLAFKPRATYPGRHKWEDVAYMVAFMGLNGQNVVSGRSVGLRDDGAVCIADYIFSPLWTEGFDWTAVGRERLDTYLVCECEEDKTCEYHVGMMQEWLQEGLERLTALGQSPIPMAMEAFIRKQQSTPKIIRPGR